MILKAKNNGPTSWKKKKKKKKKKKQYTTANENIREMFLFELTVQLEVEISLKFIVLKTG